MICASSMPTHCSMLILPVRSHSWSFVKLSCINYKLSILLLPLLSSRQSHLIVSGLLTAIGHNAQTGGAIAYIVVRVEITVSRLVIFRLAVASIYASTHV